MTTSTDLDNALCTDHLPVIVNVQSSHGSHYVVVKSKEGTATDGSQYAIEDPGYSKQSLADYGNTYTIVGVIRDPTDRSQLNLNVGDNAEILVVDSSGRRTGFDAISGQIPREIPASSYLRTVIDDDVTGDSSTGLNHSAQVLRPTSGNFRITVNGVALGLYRLSVYTYLSDGTLQAVLNNDVLASPGASQTYELQFSQSAGSVSQVVRVATFQSTLDDVSNSFRLGLIEGTRLADRLSDSIERARKQATEGDTRDARETLREFNDEVNDRTPKRISEIAARILLGDADSLLKQLPEPIDHDDEDLGASL